MTSEDLRLELSDLNYLCCHVLLASKGFCELIHRRRRPKRTDRPACFAASKNNISATKKSEISYLRILAEIGKTGCG